ncbi:hypothetical protein Syun_000476 [Stephania yunnanensis]|uniref:Uncharacterized protein n=1 Tax=Stephania yunnanensis TaxID=152371 RepID=A0AAP0LC75_9MAGN
MLRYFFAIICQISRIPACASCGHFYDVHISHNFSVLDYFRWIAKGLPHHLNQIAAIKVAKRPKNESKLIVVSTSFIVKYRSLLVY